MCFFSIYTFAYPGRCDWDLLMLRYVDMVVFRTWTDCMLLDKRLCSRPLIGFTSVCPSQVSFSEVSTQDLFLIIIDTTLCSHGPEGRH